MPERNPMIAAGDTASLVLPRDFNGTVTASVGPGGAPAGFNVVLELSNNNGASWEIATMNKPDRTNSAALAAVNTSGWAEAPGYTDARLRLTAIASGAVDGRLNWRKG
jgi:hypothetical protein